MSALPKTDILLVTKTELLRLKKAENAFAEATKALADAERALKPLRLALAEKVLGVQSADDFKGMTPEEVEKAFKRRTWQLALGAPGFSFEKTNEGRYPRWKEEFIAWAGEAEAERVIARTPPSFSYKVEFS